MQFGSPISTGAGTPTPGNILTGLDFAQPIFGSDPDAELSPFQNQPQYSYASSQWNTTGQHNVLEPFDGGAGNQQFVLYKLVVSFPTKSAADNPENLLIFSIWTPGAGISGFTIMLPTTTTEAAVTPLVLDFPYGMALWTEPPAPSYAITFDCNVAPTAGEYWGFFAQFGAPGR
jgi:hypothetical protein